ncbi:MAG: hypothetical protein WC686_03410 [Candidatus Shapirobacteria bacterium]|jgi:hypothetical protein
MTKSSSFLVTPEELIPIIKQCLLNTNFPVYTVTYQPFSFKPISPQQLSLLINFSQADSLLISSKPVNSAEVTSLTQFFDEASNFVHFILPKVNENTVYLSICNARLSDFKKSSNLVCLFSSIKKSLKKILQYPVYCQSTSNKTPLTPCRLIGYSSQVAKLYTTGYRLCQFGVNNINFHLKI